MRQFQKALDTNSNNTNDIGKIQESTVIVEI